MALTVNIVKLDVDDYPDLVYETWQRASLAKELSIWLHEHGVESRPDYYFIEIFFQDDDTYLLFKLRWL